MDPTSIVGSPIDRWVWLSPDWSQNTPAASATAARPKDAPPGATLVKVRNVLYNNGRTVTLVLDEQGRPLAADGTPTTTDKARVLEEGLDDDQQKKWKAAQGTVKPTNVYVGVNPKTGKPTQVTELPDGTKTYDDTQVPAAAASAGRTSQVEGTPDPSKPGGFDNSRPRTVTRDQSGAIVEAKPLTTAELTQWQQEQGGGGASGKVPVEGHPGVFAVKTVKPRPGGGTDEETHYENAAGQPVPAPAPPGQIVPGTTGSGAQYTGILNPTTNEIQWTDNPNAVPPKDQRWIFRRSGDGPPTREKNPYYEKPSKLIQDPQDSRKWLNVTEDDNGNPVILPVTNQTTIRPADLPVLQTKYGEIASGLAALAQDLNRKFAAGEITDKERTDAFAAAHGQADTAVAEINSILSNSRAVWSGQVTQRGQSLEETQSRRSYASSIANRAMQTGSDVALHSGKGSGAAIAAGVGALMRMGQRYAEGMGGFRESPEIALPAALQQAQGIGLPGFGPEPVAAGSGPGGPVGASSGPGGPPAPLPPSGISNTTDAGGVPREYTPASSAGPGAAPPRGPLPAPLLPPRPPVNLPPSPSAGGPPPALGQGQDLSTPPPGPMGLVPGMGSALAASQGYSGSPVAAGGAGMFDPMLEAQGMSGDGSDPAWAEAVRRAAQAHAQQQGSGRYG